MCAPARARCRVEILAPAGVYIIYDILARRYRDITRRAPWTLERLRFITEQATLPQLVGPPKVRWGNFKEASRGVESMRGVRYMDMRHGTPRALSDNLLVLLLAYRLVRLLLVAKKSVEPPTLIVCFTSSFTVPLRTLCPCSWPTSRSSKLTSSHGSRLTFLCSRPQLAVALACSRRPRWTPCSCSSSGRDAPRSFGIVSLPLPATIRAVSLLWRSPSPSVSSFVVVAPTEHRILERTVRLAGRGLTLAV